MTMEGSTTQEDSKQPKCTVCGTSVSNSGDLCARCLSIKIAKEGSDDYLNS